MAGRPRFGAAKQLFEQRPTSLTNRVVLKERLSFIFDLSSNTGPGGGFGGGAGAIGAPPQQQPSYSFGQTAPVAQQQLAPDEERYQKLHRFLSHDRLQIWKHWAKQTEDYFGYGVVVPSMLLYRQSGAEDGVEEGGEEMVGGGSAVSMWSG